MWRLRLSFDVITEQLDLRKCDITVSEDAKSQKTKTKNKEPQCEERNILSPLGSFNFRHKPENVKAL